MTKQLVLQNTNSYEIGTTGESFTVADKGDYINATEVCKRYNKLWGGFFRLKGTENAINDIAISKGFPPPREATSGGSSYKELGINSARFADGVVFIGTFDEFRKRYADQHIANSDVQNLHDGNLKPIVITIKGGTPTLQGTWIAWELGLDLLRWANPGYGRQLFYQMATIVNNLREQPRRTVLGLTQEELTRLAWSPKAITNMLTKLSNKAFDAGLKSHGAKQPKTAERYARLKQDYIRMFESVQSQIVEPII